MAGTLSAGVLYALATAVTIGSITTFARVYYNEGGDGTSLMMVRFVASASLIGLFALTTGRSLIVGQHERRSVFKVALVWAASMICYLKSVETISVSLAVLILYTYPLLVLMLSMLNKRIDASLGHILLFVLAFVGLALALFSGDVRIDSLGLTLACCAALGAAYTFFAGADVAPRVSSWAISFWTSVIGVVLLSPFMGDGIARPTGSAGLWALIIATLCYAVAVVCQFAALSRMSAAKASFLLNLEPVVSILLAAVVLSETLTLIQWAGVVLILGVLFGSSGTLFRRPSDGEN
ncbi:MAG: EamA family transporter [Pseudomonadota bacterium]